VGSQLRPDWHFLAVTDPQQRAALGKLWGSAARSYLERRAAAEERIARLSAAVG
jgi:hypothetical protein